MSSALLYTPSRIGVIHGYALSAFLHAHRWPIPVHHVQMRQKKLANFIVAEHAVGLARRRIAFRASRRRIRLTFFILPATTLDESWSALIELGLIDYPDGKEIATHLSACTACRSLGSCINWLILQAQYESKPPTAAPRSFAK